MLVCEADLASHRRHGLAQAFLKAFDVNVCGPYEADFLGSRKQAADCLGSPGVKRRMWPPTNRGFREQAGQR